jgi:seryl-tRNA synthetase
VNLSVCLCVCAQAAGQEAELHRERESVLAQIGNVVHASVPVHNNEVDKAHDCDPYDVTVNRQG